MGKDWLETLKIKQQRAAQLRAELSIIEAELRDAKNILSGRMDPAVPDQAKRRSRHGFTGGKRAKPIQEESSVWWSAKILKEFGKPLHIDALLERVNTHSKVQVQKPTLVSNLSRYVTHGDTFSRPAPSTFGLLEWDTVTEGEWPDGLPHQDTVDPTDDDREVFEEGD